jgi:hypothetical protein
MTSTQSFDFNLLLDVTRNALRRAAIADPAAAKELALDLSELWFLKRDQRQRESGSAIHRAAGEIIKLRVRFGDDVPGLSKPEINDGPARMFQDADGEFWGADEKGMWMYVIDEVLEHGRAPFVVEFKTFLHEWREQVLRTNPPPTAA